MPHKWKFEIKWILNIISITMVRILNGRFTQNFWLTIKMHRILASYLSLDYSQTVNNWDSWNEKSWIFTATTGNRLWVSKCLDVTLLIKFRSWRRPQTLRLNMDKPLECVQCFFTFVFFCVLRLFYYFHSRKSISWDDTLWKNHHD